MTKALVIVDVQYDFIEGGSLAVAGGHDLAVRLAAHLRLGGFAHYDYIVTTQDYHIDPGAHFSATPDFIDTWPVHCVAGERGSAIVDELAATLKGHVDIAVHKGEYEAAYSGFEGKVVTVGDRAASAVRKGDTLAAALRALGVTEVSTVGIAEDYCVRESAIDAASEGFTTRVLTDFTVGINAEKMATTRSTDFPAAGVEVV